MPWSQTSRNSPPLETLWLKLFGSNIYITYSWQIEDHLFPLPAACLWMSCAIRYWPTNIQTAHWILSKFCGSMGNGKIPSWLTFQGQRSWSQHKKIIISYSFIPHPSFKVRSFKFGMNMLFNGLLYISFIFAKIKNWIGADNFLHIWGKSWDFQTVSCDHIKLILHDDVSWPP